MMTSKRFRVAHLWLTALVALACTLPAYSQALPPAADRNLVTVPVVTEAAAAPRFALVIGNSDYKNGRLANPVNDARDIAKALSGLGFNVMLKENTTLRELKQSIRTFAGRIRGGGVGLFYFAGHGVQSKGKNYLIPVDADIGQEYELEDQAQDANLVMAAMDEAQNPVNIMILDACRNNPFARSFRSASNGLAQMEAPKGTLIAYATAPGSVASDGAGLNGIYTKHLLRNLQQGDSDIAKVFSRVRAGVVQETGSKQIPWESTSMVGDFYFNPSQAAMSASAKPSDAPVQVSALALEISYWQSVERTNTVSALDSYLKRYPEGQFADLAKTKLTALSRSPAGTGDLNAGPMASLTVYRERNLVVGNDGNFVIRIDGKEVGTLKNGSYFTIKVPAGTRNVTSDSYGFNLGGAVEFAPGGNYFAQLDVGSFSTELKMQDENEGRRAIRSLTERGAGISRMAPAINMGSSPPKP